MEFLREITKLSKQCTYRFREVAPYKYTFKLLLNCGKHVNMVSHKHNHVINTTGSFPSSFSLQKASLLMTQSHQLSVVFMPRVVN